jgi:polar amino acid transport system substrate-binding protein
MKALAAAMVAFVVLAIAAPNTSFAQQVLKAGSTTAGQPTSGLNSQTKQLEGISVELLRAVARDAGLAIEFQPMTFAELQPALLDKKIDIIAASYGVTTARQKLVDFTEVYGSYRDVLIVRSDEMKVYRSVADFKGMSIATPRGSAYVDALKEAGANLTLVSTPPEAISELEAGHVAGVVDNGLQIAYRMRNNAYPDLKVVDSYQPIQEGKLAYAVRKGNADLLAKLNASLTKLQADGTLKTIYSKWGVN